MVICLSKNRSPVSDSLIFILCGLRANSSCAFLRPMQQLSICKRKEKQETLSLQVPGPGLIERIDQTWDRRVRSRCGGGEIVWHFAYCVTLILEINTRSKGCWMTNELGTILRWISCKCDTTGEILHNFKPSNGKSKNQILFFLLSFLSFLIVSLFLFVIRIIKLLSCLIVSVNWTSQLTLNLQHDFL